MDRQRFDALARLLATSGSRRAALAALLGVTILGQSPDVLAKRDKDKKGRDNQRKAQAERKDKDKDKDKNRQRDGDKARDRGSNKKDGDKGNDRGGNKKGGHKKGNGKRKDKKKRERQKKRSQHQDQHQDQGGDSEERVQDEASCCGTRSCPDPRIGINVTYCNYQGRSFVGKNFGGMNFTGINGKGTDFSSIRGSGTAWSGACLQGAKFVNAYLPSTQWQNACLFDADLTGAKLALNTPNFLSAKFCRTKMPNGYEGLGDRDCGKATACCAACDAAHPCAAGERCCAGVCRKGNCCAASDCKDEQCQTKTCSNFTCTYTPVADGPGPLCTTRCCSGSCCVGTNVCDANDQCCTADTCQSLGKECGSWPDGCGNTLNCGGCPCQGCAANEKACNPTGICVPCVGSDASTCPTPQSAGYDPDCAQAECTNETCGFSFTPAGESCNDDGGTVCDGEGSCVGCVDAGDCPTPQSRGFDAECATATCIEEICGFSFEPAGETCDDTDVCDGNGHCVECNAASDCPTPQSAGYDPDCATATCIEETCGFSFEPAGETCNDDGGTVCDGDGHCVGCVDAGDCPTPESKGFDPACATATCVDETCGFSFEPAGETCNSDNVCDGEGHCVECVDAGDCPTPAEAGYSPDCAAAVCTEETCGFTFADPGVTCDTNGGTVCDGDGNCVQCVDAGDCPTPESQGYDPACAQATCVEETCGFDFAKPGVTCDDDDVCDGEGHCVECNVAGDCPTPESAGYDPDCATATCIEEMCGFSFAQSGATCDDDGGVVCDGDGNCVACVGSDASTCPTPQSAGYDPDCATAVCSNETCGFAFADEGATCDDAACGACNGNGHCVSQCDSDQCFACDADNETCEYQCSQPTPDCDGNGNCGCDTVTCTGSDGSDICCPFGSACALDDTCPCADDEDCPANQFCCSPTAGQGTCRECCEPENCPSEICVENECLDCIQPMGICSGGFCDLQPDKACCCFDGSTCSANGPQDVERQCILKCNNSGQCPAGTGTVCDGDGNNDFCKTPCTSDADCQVGLECVPAENIAGNVCMAIVCEDNSDCPPGRVCVENGCLIPD